MKIIKLNENQEKELLEFLVLENRYPVDTEKVLIIKNFLDKNFKRGNITEFGENGLPNNKPVVGMLSNGQIVKNLTASQLFDVLENEFRGMFSDKIQRSKFIAQVIKDWYYKKITKEGLLSTTFY
jgi:hypothetical protein